jgi:hypoxia-inducible factor (prolyl hydroxylase)
MKTTSSVDLSPSSINNRLAHKQAVRDSNQQDYIDMRASGNLPQEWLDTICRHMIDHMNSFGICVIDDFLGSLKGEMILKEVKQLFSNRSYTTGKLVSDKLVRGSTNTGLSQANQPVVDTAKTIRNDRVIWVNGCEEGCEEINNLIQTLCSVITNSSRLSLYSNNGLDKVVISKRTKAHVACYPGNGTRYIKHVDNPNGDGRVITAIYYLNKSWNTKRDGGLLRMFPAGVETVANIEPLFDRVLFFWSDRRNPHEVLPAYRNRFAITVWYIGESRAQES